jgi:transcription antitermination factor NusA-like protein
MVGDLLTRHVPELASGELEIVAIARVAGQLSKVAVRRRLGLQPSVGRPVPLVLGQAGERIHGVRVALGAGERVHVVQWQAEPQRYIAAALGLSYIPTMMLYPVRRRAEVLLGEIDYPAARGPRETNMLLATGLTSWHLRVKQIARSRNWRALEAAHAEARPVRAQVVGRAPKGLRVQVYGLNALLPFGQLRNVKRGTPRDVVEAKIQHRLGQELLVRVLRLDGDRGTIIVSEDIPLARQLRLPV